MKVAVTVWNDRISPVFDASRRLLIAEIKNRQITDRSYLVFDPALPANLAKILVELEVPVLICGAVSQVPAAIITAGGIQLVPFIAGEVERVLDVYAKEGTLAPTFSMPGCRSSTPGASKNAH